MCGIFGLISSKPVDPAILQAMTTTLRHRGPDASGLFFNEARTVALGHTRLRIIDLSAEANQPFLSSSGRYVVVFNGEIYNFLTLKKELQDQYHCSFRTNSDTEVIAEAFATWGRDMVNKFNGMFAIVIFDKELNKIHLFRDPAGKKPIFYFESDDFFSFSSEIKALLTHPGVKSRLSIDKKAIASFLHLGYIPEPMTIYNEIRKFPAAHSAELDSNFRLIKRPYWNVVSQLSPERVSSEEIARDKIKKSLSKAVQDRLISDVPLGCFLSGGIDSSLITALAAQNVSGPLETFSIGFKESRFDESQHARAVAKHLKTHHNEFILDQHAALDVMGSYLSHFDEPFADTSAIPTLLVSKLARSKVTVALTGDGGDELFQGYGSYVWANRLSNPFFKIIKPALRYACRLSGQSRLNRVADLLSPVRQGAMRSHIFSQEQYFFSQEEIFSKLLKKPDNGDGFHYEDVAGVQSLSEGEKQAIFDFQYYLKDDLLVKVDRASMYHALECRNPFLDLSVVRLAFSIQEDLKLRKGVGKWILREVLKDFLPEELVNRPKQGFSIPLAGWLQGELKYLVDKFLDDQLTDELGLFNKEYIQALKQKFFGGQEYLYHRLWVIIVLQKWLTEHDGCEVN